MSAAKRTQQRRLERAGYVALKGWVPAACGERVEKQVEMHREDVERILSEPPQPRGRPKKEA